MPVKRQHQRDISVTSGDEEKSDIQWKRNVRFSAYLFAPLQMKTKDSWCSLIHLSEQTQMSPQSSALTSLAVEYNSSSFII